MRKNMSMCFPTTTGKDVEDAQNGAMVKDYANDKNFRTMSIKSTKNQTSTDSRMTEETAKALIGLTRELYVNNKMKRLSARPYMDSTGCAYIHINMKCASDWYEFNIPLNEETAEYIVGLLADEDVLPLSTVHDFTAGGLDEYEEYLKQEAEQYARSVKRTGNETIYSFRKGEIIYSENLTATGNE